LVAVRYLEFLKYANFHFLRFLQWQLAISVKIGSAVCCSLFDGIKKVTCKKGQNIMVQVGICPVPPAQPIATEIGVDYAVADVISMPNFNSIGSGIS